MLTHQRVAQSSSKVAISSSWAHVGLTTQQLGRRGRALIMSLTETGAPMSIPQGIRNMLMITCSNPMAAKSMMENHLRA